MKYLFLLPALAAAVWFFTRDDRFPDYHYKMTVYIDGRAYSSVRAVEQEEKSSIVDSSGSTVDTDMRGQAVIIDHRDGQTYYALIGKPGSPQYGASAAELALMPIVNRSWRGHSGGDLARRAATRQAMVAITGEQELRPRIPAKELSPGALSTEPDFEAWPMFVTFSDPSDPSSVQEVDPQVLGVDRITIAITDDDVSEGIENKLPWLPGYYDMKLSGDRFELARNAHKGIAAFISSGSFSVGNEVKKSAAE